LDEKREISGYCLLPFAEGGNQTGHRLLQFEVIAGVPSRMEEYVSLGAILLGLLYHLRG
jgi:hypothetical protein